MCPHCGTKGTRRIGECSVCGRHACDHCGNVQFVRGERKVTHQECFKKHGDSFTMIKFVK